MLVMLAVASAYAGRWREASESRNEIGNVYLRQFQVQRWWYR